MKVQITYNEIQYFKNTIEVEMTENEYKNYLKLSTEKQEQVFNFTAETDEKHHYCTEILSIDIEKIN